MDNKNCNMKTPGSAEEWFDLGVSLRQDARFGEAMNAFMNAADTDDVLLRSKALASIELLKEINGFVNADLMNP